MGSLPGLRATGQKVWSRFVSVDQAVRGSSSAAPDPKWQALRAEVERVAATRSRRERAAQLARVLDAVTALAEAHGLSEVELNALRAGNAKQGSWSGIGPRAVAELKQRASGVVAQVWSSGTASAVRAVRKQTDRMTPRSIATALVKRQLVRTARSFRSRPAPSHQGSKGNKVNRTRTPFVLRVGRPPAAAGSGRGPQLIAASLLHLPRLQRQMLALRRSADAALSTAKLVRMPLHPIAREQFATASVLLWSGRSGVQLTYEVASAGAQLFLRSYVFPRVLRYLTAGLRTGVALREVATARVLPPAR